MSHSESEERRVSVPNWMGTIFLSWLPGLNIIFFIVFICCARTREKRSYAVGGLILSLILLVLVAAAVLFFGIEIADWARNFKFPA